ncbi:MAG: hypothetical protein M0038_02110 [Pseudomonadota bacterium]|jgi:hypothetical protein|nr:hypothetical protein [Pseudomonadota bacterium]
MDPETGSFMEPGKNFDPDMPAEEIFALVDKAARKAAAGQQRSRHS